MKGYHANIEQETLKNTYFRKVLFTGVHTQLVVMCIPPGEEIGTEVHEGVDQFFRVESGEGKFVIDGEETTLLPDEVAIIPAGSMHNIVNTSQNSDLKLYTLYSPPNHPEGLINRDKKEAEEYEQAHHH